MVIALAFVICLVPAIFVEFINGRYVQENTCVVDYVLVLCAFASILDGIEDDMCYISSREEGVSI